MPKVELRIGPRPVHVRTARLVAAALGRRIGLDSVALDEVKLAVGEACSRAVGVNAAGSGEPVVVHFRDDDEILEVAVMDSGPAGASLPVAESTENAYLGSYEAAAHPDGDPTNLAPGLGLAMIVGLVDDVSIEDRPGPAGTVVTMRWPIASF